LSLARRNVERPSFRRNRPAKGKEDAENVSTLRQPHGKLDLVVEAFNLSYRLNVTQFYVLYGPLAMALPTFGRPVDAGGATHSVVD